MTDCFTECWSVCSEINCVGTCYSCCLVCIQTIAVAPTYFCIGTSSCRSNKKYTLVETEKIEEPPQELEMSRNIKIQF